MQQDDDLDEQSERINARLDELRATFRDSFDEYAAACLKIRTKSGAVAPLILNRSQFYLHQRLEAQRKEKGRVRALVLKARQVGISTYIGGRKYWRTTHGRGQRAFILTHLDVASENLFDIAKRYRPQGSDITIICSPPMSFAPGYYPSNLADLLESG